MEEAPPIAFPPIAFPSIVLCSKQNYCDEAFCQKLNTAMMPSKVGDDGES